VIDFTTGPSGLAGLGGNILVAGRQSWERNYRDREGKCAREQGRQNLSRIVQEPSRPSPMPAIRRPPAIALVFLLVGFLAGFRSAPQRSRWHGNVRRLLFSYRAVDSCVLPMNHPDLIRVSVDTPIAEFAQNVTTVIQNAVVLGRAALTVKAPYGAGKGACASLLSPARRLFYYGETMARTRRMRRAGQMGEVRDIPQEMSNSPCVSWPRCFSVEVREDEIKVATALNLLLPTHYRTADDIMPPLLRTIHEAGDGPRKAARCGSWDEIVIA